MDFFFQEEQQRLRGTIEEADEMIRSLDDCIHELETGMATVGFVGEVVLSQGTGRAEGEMAVRPLSSLGLEVAAVEEKGVDDKSSLKSRQEGNS